MTNDPSWPRLALSALYLAVTMYLILRREP